MSGFPPPLTPPHQGEAIAGASGQGTRVSAAAGGDGLAGTGDGEDVVVDPGMCGKPRKLTALANLAWQVANCLSQPAVTVKVSPGAMVSAMACHSSIVTALPSSVWRFTSCARPALAPLVKVTSPRVNQPEAKASRPEAVSCRVVAAVSTVPVPRNAGSSRSTVQRASPRSASQPD